MVIKIKIQKKTKIDFVSYMILNYCHVSTMLSTVIAGAIAPRV